MAVETNVTYAGQSKVDALSGKLNFEQGEGRIVGRDDNNITRLLINTNPFEMKVSKEGFDAFTAANDELIFNSSQNVFKIVFSGTATLDALTINTGGASWSASVGSNTLVIPHGLGYVPAILAYWDIGGEYSPLPITRTITAAGSSFMMYSILAFVDATNIKLSSELTGYNVNTSFGSVNIKYYLLQETAN